MNIFVGNLSFEANEIDVQRVFSAFGVVTSVAIVMEKKGKKSRGFGFVEMPDEQEALAAIAQLNGQEILGRPINVTSAVSKGPKSEPADKRNKYSSAVTQNNRGGFAPRGNPVLKRTGKYKEGRRTISFIKKRMETGVTGPLPERRYKPNPMRWRKKPRWETPYAKPEGERELKPWQRPQTESNPWKKPRTAQSSSWKKPEGEPKLWQRSQGGSKPWEKSRGEARPWKKAEGAAAGPRPWKKSASSAKPWRKGSADRAQSGFKKRSSFKKQ